MGKSKKKIKADQINILRKQYDAFLEEDKKRKERNEHILDKLDKIRLSNTVTRYKSNIYFDQRVSFNCAGETPIKTYPHPQTHHPAKDVSMRKFEDILTPTAELNVLAKPLDEIYIINQISKKYILIPKLRSAVSEDYIPRAIKQDNNNDSDWKSKYSILDTLKQNEKEDTNNSSVIKSRSGSFIDNIPSKEAKYRVNDKAIENTSNREVYEIKNNMVPAKKSTNRFACLEDNERNVTTDIENENTYRQFDNIPKLNTNVSSALKTDTEVNGVDKDHQGASGEQDQPDRGQYNYLITDDHGHVSSVSKNSDRDDQQSYVVYSDKHENEDTEKPSPVVDDIRHVEVIDSIKPAAQKTKSDNQNVGNHEKIEYPIDIINVKDFTPAEGVPLVDGVNVNPDSRNVSKAHLAPQSDQSASTPPAPEDQVYLPGATQPAGGDHYLSEPTATVEQAYLPGADNHIPSGNHYISEPVAVAAEHKDITEQLENTEQVENTDQQLTQEGAYDPDAVSSEIEAFEAEQKLFYDEQANYQEGLGDVYSPETGNFDPAVYYAGEGQDATYPAEINEHEETSQRYDPSYEEQYTGKSSEQEQHPQQYAVAEPQQYEQQQYNEQQYGNEQLYGEQEQYGEEQYPEQEHYGEQQQYGEQQPYAEQQVAQIQGESTVITTAREYTQEPFTHEQESIEQIEQQLDNEEFGVPNQDGGVGDIVDESVIYTQDSQNAGDVTATEPYVENQNPQPSP